MAKNVVEMREENRTLLELFQQGTEEKLWKSKAEAAALIRTNVSTFLNRLSGRAHGKGVQESIKRLRALLPKGTEKKQDEVKNGEMMALFLEGKELGLWKNFTDCAPHFKLHRDTFAEHVKANPKKLSKRKLQNYRRIEKAMRKKVRGDPPKDQASPVSVEEFSITELVSEVISGTLFNQLLAGVAELRDQNLDGMRFVLTAKNFRRLEGIVTQEEVRDTKVLIEELRRRLNMLTEIEDEGIRTLCHKVLGKELSELFLAYRLFQEVVPTAAAVEIDSLRTQFRDFHT